MEIKKIREIIKNFFKLDYNEFIKKYNFKIDKETFDYINGFNITSCGEELIWLKTQLKDNNEITIFEDSLVELCNENGYEIKASTIHKKIKMFLIDLIKAQQGLLNCFFYELCKNIRDSRLSSLTCKI